MAEIDTSSFTAETKEIGVFLVDSNQGRRAFFNTVLRRNGDFFLWTSAELTDAEAVLECMAAHEIHLVIFDIDLVCDKKSLAFIQKIVSSPVLVSSEIIFIGDNLTQEDEILIKECGVSRVLPKRIAAAELIRQLKDVFSEHVARRPHLCCLRDISKAIQSKDSESIRAMIHDEEVTKALERIPEYTYLKGEMLITLCEYELAAKEMKKLIQNDSNFDSVTIVRCLATLGKALCFQQKYREALVIFDKLSSKSPHNFMHKILAGETARENGELQKAKSSFEAALRIDCENDRARIGLTSVHLLEGSLEDALTEMSKVRNNMESMSLASFFNNAGVALLREGRSNDAIHFYERAEKYFTKYAYIIYFNWALAEMHAGAYEKAVMLLSKCLQNADESFVDKKKILHDFVNLGKEGFLTKYRR